MTDLPLKGLTVLSVEQAVAAPYCTAQLAEAGARVIKVERPEGDFARGYDTAAAGESSYFVWLNRGKESVTLDLRRPEDHALLLAIADRADVMVQNLKPGALARLGLGAETLRARNPRLITCAISGYGDDGPLATRKAYDLLIQAESGLSSITGGPEAPARVGISIVDIATGAAAHAAILEALIARSINGSGSEIRISMFDVIADWLAVPYLHAAAGTAPRRIGLAHPSISPYGVFRSKDGKDLLISIQNDREWAVLAEQIMGRPDLVQAPGFASNNARVANRDRVDAEVAACIAQQDLAALADALDAAGIAFAGVNEMDGLIAHPQLSTATAQLPDGTAVTLPASAVRRNGDRRSALGQVPALGEHSVAIRAEFSAS
jgi:itaconate CoA-transferase